MPELPDVTIYVERLRAMAVGHSLEKIRLASPFVLRSVDPPIAAAAGKRIVGARRIGKRIVIELDDALFIVIHLMIAGRLRWQKRHVSIPRKRGLAAFDLDVASILFTEASPKKRASLHLVRGEEALADHDPGGIDPLTSSTKDIAAALTRENHTLKRALTDPRILSGIGNAYSDEILHRARQSPFKQTQGLGKEEMSALIDAIRAMLTEWVKRTRAEVGDGFPDKVTAFREGMAVHGRHRQPCPVCGSPVQRIVYADNEANYCATCQTGGKLFADRALSRLLKQNWPRTLEQLEALRQNRDPSGRG